jgi:hypothetical protein
MTHEFTQIHNAPKVVSALSPTLPLTRSAETTQEIPRQVGLAVKGQGIASTRTGSSTESFTLRLSTKESTPRGFELGVFKDYIVIRQIGGEEITLDQEQNNYSTSVTTIGIDPDPTCQYWFSLDPASATLRYGKGEMRLATLLVECRYTEAGQGNTGEYEWVKEIEQAAISVQPVELLAWRDPVTIEPPVAVVATDEITMDMAATYAALSPGELSLPGQALYSNVSGKMFTLNTPDFPCFTDAIEYSIRTPGCWCHTILEEKACEFGECNPLATYLRITMGVNQGNSPGIPYVVEIWPPGHFSPIHNHAYADAIIRVLHGEITVNLYPMLSKDHTTPFATKTFTPDQVTWLSPDMNQTHQLKNANLAGPTCITIQCYQYGEENNSHYECFDYLDSKTGKIKQFIPNSDADFIWFKEKMRQEWVKANKA